MTSHPPAPGSERRVLSRWLVHLGLIATLVVSLMFEPLVLAIHIAVGLVFAVLAGLHLAQRRRVSASLLARLARVRVLARPAGPGRPAAGGDHRGHAGLRLLGLVRRASDEDPLARHHRRRAGHPARGPHDPAPVTTAPLGRALAGVLFPARVDAVRPGDGSDLVWSPTDAEDRLLGLINGATRSLRIYSEEMGDRTVGNALVKAAKRGVEVQVCGENESGEYDSAYAKLARAGIRISYYSSPAGFYIHGKVVEADYGTARAKIFIGSENFSSTSLNQNRELGLIISSHPVMSAVASTFAADFRNGTRWS